MDLGEPRIAEGNRDPHPHIASDRGGIPIIGGSPYRFYTGSIQLYGTDHTCAVGFSLYLENGCADKALEVVSFRVALPLLSTIASENVVIAVFVFPA